VGDEDLDAWVSRTAGELAGLSADALAVLKRCLRRQDGHDDFVETERRYVRELARTPDAVEGLRAFLEKRAPQWRGRA
jgi:enoyl-CoA hydratase/carnithine racemase